MSCVAYESTNCKPFHTQNANNIARTLLYIRTRSYWVCDLRINSPSDILVTGYNLANADGRKVNICSRKKYLEWHQRHKDLSPHLPMDTSLHVHIEFRVELCTHKPLGTCGNGYETTNDSPKCLTIEPDGINDA